MEPETIQKVLKVLVLDEEIPYPPNSGKRIRTWNLLRLLARKHQVHLLCYGKEGAGAAALRSAGIILHLVEPLKDSKGLLLYLKLALNLFSSYPFSVSKHYSKRFQRAYDELVRNIAWDLIHCEWTPYARFLSAVGNVPTLIATHNVESLIWQRRAEHGVNLAETAFFGLQARKMERFERRALHRATAVSAVTADDAQTMQNWGIPAVTLIPNGVDTELYRPSREPEHDNEILSVASLDWFPNASALEYFTERILPLIREKNPQAVLRIVGRRPSDSLRKKFTGVPGIDFVGEVGDVRPYLERASAIIVPLRIGGGSRLKILEALAAGKAVVSTTIGAEGLELEHERHLLVADSPDEFARRVLEVLTSKDARRRLGECGRALVLRCYGWDGIAGRLESAWYETSRQFGYEAPMDVAAREMEVTP
jgi:glycosyltransferase involved in cell wall biosynthesis